MTARNRHSRHQTANRESDQSLTSDKRRNLTDRPTDGALHPVHGTIAAPFVVVGATGTIGRAVVDALTAAGRPVLAVAPDVDRLEALRAAFTPGAVTTLTGRIERDVDAARLVEELRALARPFAGVVVTFPHGRSAEVGVDRGRLLDQSSDVLGECLTQTVLAQHALARHLIPLLAASHRNAHYVIVGGPGSETPWAGYGHRSVATAATRMLARVLHDEARPAGVRVQLLSIDSPVRSELPSEHECPEWPSASDVARSVMRLVERGAADEPTDAIVPCGRASAAACSLDRVARAFTDVPTFLASLRRPPKKIAPQ
jgi:NAD(P)-dependent dehydrogenase (short-subunit alcohol dehydrogenase family)